MTGNMEKLEQRLAREAAAYGARKTATKTHPRQALWKICGLTGLAPMEEGFHVKARDRLRRMLAAQRRWARIA
ncbi:MAG: hypothetical protein KDJ80_13795, partial [Nitratireductor sp.]|nr:hypothetical protein [Nitratireductor sp.]